MDYKCEEKYNASRSGRVLDLMKDASDLFKNKNSGYGEAYITATKVMDILVPRKSTIRDTYRGIVYHNLYAVVVKLCRVASIVFNGGSDKCESTKDSWIDLGVYGFMMAEVSDSYDRGEEL